jgi:hypothetical protein
MRQETQVATIKPYRKTDSHALFDLTLPAEPERRVRLNTTAFGLASAGDAGARATLASVPETMEIEVTDAERGFESRARIGDDPAPENGVRVVTFDDDRPMPAVETFALDQKAQQ